MRAVKNFDEDRNKGQMPGDKKEDYKKEK